MLYDFVCYSDSCAFCVTITITGMLLQHTCWYESLYTHVYSIYSRGNCTYRMHVYRLHAGVLKRNNSAGIWCDSTFL